MHADDRKAQYLLRGQWMSPPRRVVVHMTRDIANDSIRNVRNRTSSFRGEYKRSRENSDASNRAFAIIGWLTAAKAWPFSAHPYNIYPPGLKGSAVARLIPSVFFGKMLFFDAAGVLRRADKAAPFIPVR